MSYSQLIVIDETGSFTKKQFRIVYTAGDPE